MTEGSQRAVSTGGGHNMESLQAVAQAITPAQAASMITAAENIVFLTGAGVSSSAGVKTFEELDEAWSLDEPRHVVFSLPYFLQEPVKFWSAYRRFRNSLYSAHPTDFHYAVAHLEKSHNVTVLTQNIDTLHTKAGSSNVIEHHGSISHLRCLRCLQRFDVQGSLQPIGIPFCPDCKFPLKPDVSLFFEGVQGMRQAREAIDNCDLLVVAGTRLQVGPINELPYHAQFREDPPDMLWINTSPPPENYAFTHSTLASSDEVAHAIMSELGG